MTNAGDGDETSERGDGHHRAAATRPEFDGELFALLVQNVKDYAIFVLTPTGHIASWNEGAQHIKGYKAVEIIGQHLSRFYEPEAIARGWPDHELEVARSVGSFEDEGWRIRKDGSRFWASVVITALFDATGKLRGFAKVTRDLTARRRMEDLQRSETRMNEFLAMLAHELRNPLAPMHSALEIAARAGNDVRILAESRQIFQRQLNHLTCLVDDLLDASRINAGKLELKLGEVDLNALVDERVAAMNPLFQSRDQHVDIAYEFAETPIVADAVRMAQVVANLLANAHKYTPRGGRIGINLRHVDHHALLNISDNGMGMEPHLLPTIFDAFVQGDRALDRREGGLGLGLTLVKRLIEMHGGTVAATSPGAGQGSTFSVRLPIRPETAKNPARDAQSQPHTSILRVLVVDDNVDISSTMALLLGMHGHIVELAHDGIEALQKAPIFRPDVALIDIGLPGISGYDVARGIRSIPFLADTLVVACTGYGGEDVMARSEAAGFNRHEIKPITEERLLDILVAADTRRAAGAAATMRN